MRSRALLATAPVKRRGEGRRGSESAGERARANEKERGRERARESVPARSREERKRKIRALCTTVAQVRVGGGLWLSSCTQNRGKVSEKRDLFVNLVALLCVRAYAIEIAGLSGSGNEFGCFCAVWPIAVAALHTAVSARGSVARISADALGQQATCLPVTGNRQHSADALGQLVARDGQTRGSVERMAPLVAHSPEGPATAFAA